MTTVSVARAALLLLLKNHQSSFSGKELKIISHIPRMLSNTAAVILHENQCYDKFLGKDFNWEYWQEIWDFLCKNKKLCSCVESVHFLENPSNSRVILPSKSHSTCWYCARDWHMSVKDIVQDGTDISLNFLKCLTFFYWRMHIFGSQVTTFWKRLWK